ncbi:MFS transporter [Bosea sp. SSUT16]|jgi:predicted MFS family arabinose efflux permease|uniref:MFS transporter n=1 Tax=Bosea spartocytisi TaxID=2773451 RepID=A0A927E609_9HYPH|nr:MFS transporter [Bosea spartocytisi]MBD3844974.1 MFS transporter [Bosea spartocytisi]MCT4471176.1 MFS transporter [Bosea spartocytisi]
MSELKPAAGHDLGALIPVLGLCGFASTFTMRLVDPLVPTLAAEFGQSIHQIAFLVTAFAGCYALGQPFLGPIADSVGKLRSISTCLALLCVLSGLAAFATNYWMLFALRAGAGVMAGGVIPAAMAAIGDRAPMAERQIMLGRFLVIMIIGQMAGASFSGVVADHIGWRAVLGVAAALAACGALVVRLVLKPRPLAERPPLSLAGAMTSYAAVFANPRSKVLYGLVLLEGALIFGLPPFVAAILHERSGTGPSEAGIAIGAMGLGGLVYGLLTRILVQRVGPAQMMRLGGLAVALADFAFILPAPWWTSIGVFLSIGFGFFLIHGTFQAQATELAPTARGSAMALFACFFFMGHATGPLLMGTALQALGTQGALALFGTAVGLLGLMAPKLLPPLGSRT